MILLVCLVNATEIYGQLMASHGTSVGESVDSLIQCKHDMRTNSMTESRASDV